MASWTASVANAVIITTIPQLTRIRVIQIRAPDLLEDQVTGQLEKEVSDKEKPG